MQTNVCLDICCHYVNLFSTNKITKIRFTGSLKHFGQRDKKTQKKTDCKMLTRPLKKTTKKQKPPLPPCLYSSLTHERELTHTHTHADTAYSKL